MDTYLAKPIRPAELFAALEGLFPGAHSGAVKPTALPEDASDAGPVVDEEELLLTVDGDRAMVTELAAMFLGECPERLHRIASAIAASDARALEQSAHALKGVLGTLFARPAAAAARDLELIGRRGDLRGAREALEVLRARLDRALPAFEEIARRRAA